MDTNEIAPQAVTTVEELYEKLEMLRQAANQRVTMTDDNGDAVGKILLNRLMEMKADLSVIEDKPEHWEPVGLMLDGIGKAVRQRTINDLHTSYSLDAVDEAPQAQ